MKSLPEQCLLLHVRKVLQAKGYHIFCRYLEAYISTPNGGKVFKSSMWHLRIQTNGLEGRQNTFLNIDPVVFAQREPTSSERKCASCSARWAAFVAGLPGHVLKIKTIQKDVQFT